MKARPKAAVDDSVLPFRPRSFGAVGIPTHCAGCGAPLGPHTLTKLCAECKLVARNRRLTGQTADLSDPVTYAEAITNVVTVLGGRIISEHAS